MNRAWVAGGIVVGALAGVAGCGQTGQPEMFLHLIRDTRSGCIVFLGRVTNLLIQR